MLLQGLHYGSDGQQKLQQYKDVFLRDLAGNAFNTFCNAAVHVVKIACLARLQVRAAEAAETQRVQVPAAGTCLASSLLDFNIDESSASSLQRSSTFGLFNFVD